MPVSFNSPPRNFFLLGSGGEDAVTNFFHNINRSSSTDNRYFTGDIRYSESDQKFLLSGNGRNSNARPFGFFEKQAYDAETDPDNPTNVEEWRTKVTETILPTNTIGQAGATLNFMRQTSDYGGAIIVGGKSGTVPWIAKFTAQGTEMWSASSQSTDVEYFDVALNSNGDIFACGYKIETYTNPPEQGNIGFIEKWDEDGNPMWGMASTRIGGDVRLNAIAANDRDQVVGVGAIDGVEWQGYVVKLDASNGELIWDLTINSGEEHQAGSKNPIELRDVYIDGKDQIYIVGSETIYDGGVINNGIIFKYSPEGNLIWQKRTPVGEEHCYYKVWSDTEVEQTVVLSHEVVAGSPTKRGPTLIKYSKNGDVVFKRRIQSSTNFAEGNSGLGLEGDPSFYYILFVDEQENVGTGASKTYNFGKVSASGNGFGEFTYDATNSKTITYSVNSAVDRIGRLSDGSVRNDTSDHISYPYNGLKTLFDDYATNIAYKKTRHEDKDLFLRSGSPSIRPVDFAVLEFIPGITPIEGSVSSTNLPSLNSARNAYVFTNPSGNATLDNHIDIDFPDDVVTGGFSVEFWFNCTKSGTSFILTQVNPTAGDPSSSWRIERNNSENGTIEFGINNGSGFSGSETISSAFDDNEWHHCVCTYKNDGTVKIYQNGLLETQNNSATSSPAHQSDNILRIGARMNSSPYDFEGEIGEVRIYNRELNDGEVYQNWNATRIKYQSTIPFNVTAGWVANAVNRAGAQVCTGVVTDSNLVLFYDFGNKSCYDPAHNLFPNGRRPGINWSGAGPAASILTENTKEVKAPDGTYTATKWEFTGTDPYFYHSGTLTANKTYTMSIWVKAGTNMAGHVLQQRMGAGPYSTNANSTIPADGSWKRLTYTKTIGGSDETNVNIGFEPQYQSGINSGLPIPGDVVYVWGAQLEEAPIGSGTDRTPFRLIPTEGTVVEKQNIAYNIKNIITQGYWGFQGANGSLRGGSGNHANSDPSYDPFPTMPQGYLDFDGVGDFIKIDQTTSIGFVNTLISIDVWLYIDSLSTQFSIVNKRGNNQTQNSNRPYNFEVRTDGTLRLILQNSSTICDSAAGSIVTGEWVHVAATNDGTTARVYKNGVELTNTSSTGTTQLTNSGGVPTRIGARYTNSSFVYGDGKVGEIRMYNSGLSATQVLQNFNATRGKYGV